MAKNTQATQETEAQKAKREARNKKAREAREAKKKAQREAQELQESVSANNEALEHDWNFSESDKAQNEDSAKTDEKRAKRTDVLSGRMAWGRYIIVARTTMQNGTLYTVNQYRFSEEYGKRDDTGKIHFLERDDQWHTVTLDNDGKIVGKPLPMTQATPLEREQHHNLSVVLRNLVPASERVGRKFWFGSVTKNVLIEARNDLKTARKIARKALRGDKLEDSEKLNLDNRVLHYETFIANTREQAKLTANIRHN